MILNKELQDAAQSGLDVLELLEQLELPGIEFVPLSEYQEELELE